MFHAVFCFNDQTPRNYWIRAGLDGMLPDSPGASGGQSMRGAVGTGTEVIVSLPAVKADSNEHDFDGR